MLVTVVLVLLAFLLIFPILLTNGLKWFLSYGLKLFGKEFYIAVKNLIPQVRKNTMIILIICGLMIITVFGSITFRTIQVNGLNYLKKEYVMPIILETRSDNTKVDTKELTEKVERLPDVKSVSNISYRSTARILTPKSNLGIDYAVVDIKKLQKQGLIEKFSNVKGSSIDQSIVISQKFAKKII
ncbi:hypothetical protein AB3N02_00240 [Priestia aryabhattai]|uniref:hypothetical protein n=1 Tax=Priestia aryabhattai TaxID=412384 RepID=UPI0039A326E6